MSKNKNLKIYIYRHYGERVEPNDDDIHMAAFIPGHQDDVDICKANSKEEAITKFHQYYNNASSKNVLSYYTIGDKFCVDRIW